MKSMIIGMAAALVLTLGIEAYAGCGSCPASKAVSKCKASSTCQAAASDEALHGCAGFQKVVKSMDLTEDQRAKVGEMLKCTKADCPKACHSKVAKKMKKVLDKDQYAAFKAECRKCGLMTQTPAKNPAKKSG